jgi:hypothetical protein
MQRLTSVLVVAAVSLPAVALAGKHDLVLSRLADPGSDGKPVANNESFRSLMSELGVVLAPRALSPSDTLGFSGFQFSLESTTTFINGKNDYWCATEETATGCDDTFGGKDTKHLETIGVFARKGMWFPLPSFEIGAGAVHVRDSRMWTAQAYAKFALHEGYHEWPIPSLAARGAVSRLVGGQEIDLTVASFDVSLSHNFGIEGTLSMAPYAGWNLLWIVPRSEVIDTTPGVDANDMANDLTNNFVFVDQANIIRNRFFGGIKFKYYVFAFTAEVGVALKGGSMDDRQGTDKTCSEAPAAQRNACDAEDRSGSQLSVALSGSLDF